MTNDILQQPHMLQSKYRLYENTISSKTTMQENQPGVQIAAKHNIFLQMVPYMSWIFLVLVRIHPGVSSLGGKIVSHHIADARQVPIIIKAVKKHRWNIFLKFPAFSW